MNYQKFKKLYTSDRLKFRNFRLLAEKLSSSQKGELLLSATEDKNLDLISFLVDGLEAPVGYTNKDGINGLMILAINLYNRNDLFKLDRELDYKIAKFYLERMTSEEINAQCEKAFIFDHIFPPFSMPLLNTFHANNSRIKNISSLMFLCKHHPHKIEVELDKPYIKNDVLVKSELVEDTRVVDLIYLFRAYGAQTHLKDSNGFDAVKYAISCNNVAAIKGCTEYIKPVKNAASLPADIDAQDRFGNTNYMHSCSRMYVPGLLETLEEKGTNPNLTNSFGQSAVDIASPTWALDHVKEYTKEYNKKEHKSSPRLNEVVKEK